MAAPDPPDLHEQAMIEMRDVFFRYPEGDFELSLTSLRVESREHVAIVGPSGSGKTTLLHLAAGVVSPLRGAVAAAGIDLASLDDGRRRDFRAQNVGYVFQSFELLEYLDVQDNVLLPYRVNGSLVLDSAARDRADVLLQRVGLDGKQNRYPDQLSQGEQQRAAVCRALVTRPRLILADEPTGNLDAANKQRVMEILVQEATAVDATLVAVTHDGELLDHFQRVVDVGELAS